MRREVLAFSVCGFALIFPAMASAQTVADGGLPIADPDEILAVCGGDPGAGEANFALSCAGCHTLAEGEPHLAGPNLHGLYGRVAGMAEGYDYSDAMVSAGQAGIVWQRATLQEFLPDPVGYVPGTSHPAMPDMADITYRTDLMTHVRLTTTPPPPAPEDVVVPDAVLAMAGDVPYGEYLSGECASCHVAGAASANGVPQIDGLDREAMILALFQYRIGARDNQTMVNVAARLSDEEIVALADYFASFNES